MTAQDVCFTVVFNHRYDENIPKLERIYEKRFASLFFLVPFYTGVRPDVVSVYENSVFFHGFFAQAYERLFSERFSHYVFVADDLILHPRLNAANLVAELRLDEDAAYIKHLNPLPDQTLRWHWQLWVLETIRQPRLPSATLERELPSGEEALARLKAHGLIVRDLAWSDLKALRGARAKKWLRAFGFYVRNWKDLSLPYPYVAGYSDLIVVPAHALKRFCHYCGVFAAMNLFVEVAAPTALALACERIVVERDTPWHGREIWDAEQVRRILSEHDHDLGRILGAYDENQLYMHPLKLTSLAVAGIGDAR